MRKGSDPLRRFGSPRIWATNTVAMRICLITYPWGKPNGMMWMCLHPHGPKQRRSWANKGVGITRRELHQETSYCRFWTARVLPARPPLQPQAGQRHRGSSSLLCKWNESGKHSHLCYRRLAFQRSWRTSRSVNIPGAGITEYMMSWHLGKASHNRDLRWEEINVQLIKPTYFGYRGRRQTSLSELLVFSAKLEKYLVANLCQLQVAWTTNDSNAMQLATAWEPTPAPLCHWGWIQPQKSWNFLHPIGAVLLDYA